MGVNDDPVNFDPKPLTDRISKILGIQRKTADKVDGVSSRQPRDHPQHRPPPPSDIECADAMNLLVEAVSHFNEDLVAHGSEFRVRLWDTGNGFHIQVVRESDDSVIHQTQLLLAADIDCKNIGKYIDEFIREKGLFIDFEK